MIMKMENFKKFYLIRKISSQVSHVCNFKTIFSHHDKMQRIKKKMREKLTSHQIFVQKIPIKKNAFNQNFFLCQLIFKMFAAHIVILSETIVPRKYFIYIYIIAKYL